MEFAHRFASIPYDQRDPDPWLALYLDRSIPIDDDAKAALLLCNRSRSRQFLLPLVRPLARLTIILIQLLKVIIPNRFTSSKILHRLIYWGLKYWVSPEANFLILRHFHIGSEVLAFVAANTPEIQVELNPLKPPSLETVKDDLFLKHDLNLFNFVIRLNTKLREVGLDVHTPQRLNFDAITDGPFPLEELPRRWSNFIDVQTAIELYTPLYQLFLTDNDFWRASNSLQLDETVGLYVARILRAPEQIALVNNKHPMVPLSTLMAGFRLMLHGLAAESLHALLRQHKRRAATAAA
ncbi:MAG: DUF6999 family protein [Terriglobales bacterium]